MPQGQRSSAFGPSLPVQSVTRRFSRAECRRYETRQRSGCSRRGGGGCDGARRASRAISCRSTTRSAPRQPRAGPAPTPQPVTGTQAGARAQAGRPGSANRRQHAAWNPDPVRIGGSESIIGGSMRDIEVVGPSASPRKHLRCSFCGQGPERTRRFVSGPSVYICSECVQRAMELLSTPDAD